MGKPVKDQTHRCPRCEPTQRENQCLREQLRQLSNKIDQLEQENQKLRQQHERDQHEISQLKGQLEKQRRAGKRQAAPFSRGKPKKRPKRPGRKPGSAYGPKAHRPAPERVDQILDAPLPPCCPDCHETVEHRHVVAQYQTDLPPKIQPWVTQFNVHVGHCVRCDRRVQGRHPLQTSDALGAAAAQVGPRALALAAELKP